MEQIYFAPERGKRFPLWKRPKQAYKSIEKKFHKNNSIVCEARRGILLGGFFPFMWNAKILHEL
ncbi:MAG: hypothetical protein R3A45_00900 [Bdellovibrionota bacterium]